VPGEPVAGVDGWGNFALCSYLLGQNAWTTFGCDERTGKWKPDFSKTTLMGNPCGLEAPLDAANKYCRYRRYVGTDQGAKGGIVVVNGGTSAQNISLPYDLVEETGRHLPAGTSVTLQPHTGRFFFHQNNYKYVSVVTSPVENEVLSGWVQTIQGKVIANRLGLAFPKIVQVKVDNGPWRACPVDKLGNWKTLWTNMLPGKHLIYCRAFVSFRDNEPLKVPRTVVYQKSFARR